VRDDRLEAGIEQVDLRGQSVSPGFIDVQVNGGGDVLFNDDPSVEQIMKIRDAHRRFGTTDIMVTYITGPGDGMRRAAVAVSACREQGIDGVLGIHFEGPAINPVRAGVHDKAWIRSEPADELATTYTLGPGTPTVVTLAPEMVKPGFIAQLVRQGIRVSIGHTDATFDQALGAIDEGATGGTHLWNAMSGLTSRRAGAVGALLHDDRVWCGVIADGFHVDFTTLAVSVRAKPRGRTFLVTDAMSPVGGAKDTFILGPHAVRVVDGKCQTEDGTLAGSALDMATAVRNCIQKIGIPKAEALRMATFYPARFLGLDDQLGSIRPGRLARLAIFDGDLRVSTVVTGGEFRAVSRRAAPLTQ
jgi:N-acetylglucosamine-6-phosphate deacetylase